ncbi:MAG: peptidylprolyl isomerase [Phycisphaerales bacterium]
MLLPAAIAAVVAAPMPVHAAWQAPTAPSVPAAPPTAPGAPRDAQGAAGIVAIWQQSTVTWDRLRPVIGELAGNVALREVLLDELLAERARQRGIAPDEAALEREEATLLEFLDADPARARTLLGEIRARQGLGPVRWRSLLWRNAVLRALVAADVRVEEPQVVAAHDAAHGAKRRARVIAVPDLRGAQRVQERLAAGEPFEAVAADASTDPSAARGGLVTPMSRLDPGVPAAVREALWALAKPGELSPPVLIPTGYLLVRFEGEDPGDGIALEAVRARAERSVRLAQERARMDTLAADLLRAVRPTIFDESLADSWNRVTTEATRSAPPPPG